MEIAPMKVDNISIFTVNTLECSYNRSLSGGPLFKVFYHCSDIQDSTQSSPSARLKFLHLSLKVIVQVALEVVEISKRYKTTF